MLAFLPLLAGAPALAATKIGAVSRVQGSASGTVEGVTRTLVAAAPVHLDETITTGPGARLEIRLDDGTVLTLGENAHLKVDDFIYDPGAANTLSAFIIGAFRFVSSKLPLGAKRDAKVKTPVVLIGINGTNFWAGPIDGRFGVTLFEGRIDVTSDDAAVVLDRPGQGVNVAGAGAAPGRVTNWPQEKIDRALAAVAFR